MIYELQEDKLIQLCDCGSKNKILYDDLEFTDETRRIIKLPLCPSCKSKYEFLLYTFSDPISRTNPYTQKIITIFAEVAMRYAKR